MTTKIKRKWWKPRRVTKQFSKEGSLTYKETMTEVDKKLLLPSMPMPQTNGTENKNVSVSMLNISVDITEDQDKSSEN